MSRLPLLLAPLLALLPACDGSVATDERPDVIVVVVDTLRADHMSLYGYGRPTTPQLDRLAEDAVVFDHALAGSSWTVPSMAMLFTGVYQAAHIRTLGSELASFPATFQRAGYRTGGVVANPLLGQVKLDALPGAPPVIYESGFERGFDHYDVYQHEVARDEAAYGQVNSWYADEVVERGTAWVEATDAAEDGADRSYLLYLHLFDPHFPRIPRDPDRFRGTPGRDPFAALDPALAAEHADELDELRAWAVDELALYDAEIAHVDEALGQLFAWLDERGTRDDTVVVLTADHGEGLWDRPMPVGERAKPYNRMKALYSDHGIQLYDEQVRVPLVIWSPDVPAGRYADSVSLLDVAPSLHWLANLPAPEEAAGAGGINLFEGGADRSSIFSLTSRGTSLTEDGRWRLHLPAEHLIERFGARAELYDLREDPGERRPLLDTERIPAMMDEVRAMLDLLGREQEMTEEEQQLRRQLLDSLGYTDQ